MILKGLKSGLIVVCCVAFVGLNACTGASQSAKRPETTRYSKKSTQQYQTRWQPTQQNSIPVVMNEPVKKMVGKFTTQWKSSFDKWINRIGLYGPTIEKVLDEEGVPRDLLYLSMIESGFNLSAKSHASAVGPWQFIQSTGKMYGLKNDLFMDDRRDLIVATRAAARHLKDLYNEFGDWYLAFAAYNGGAGNVNRVIRKSGSRDFWKMAHTRYMHPETKEYVPKILAALHIVKNYKQFGYSEKDFSMPLQYDLATVDDATDIGFIAAATNTSLETLQQLNPSLVSGITRPDSKTLIYLPKGKQSQFTRNYESVPASKRLNHLAHPIQNGESLKSIAAYYSLDVDHLAKFNDLKPSSDLRPGHELKIPVSKSLLLALASKPLGASKSGSSGGKTVYHKVKRGETLARVAAKYGTSAGNLAKWNKLGRKSSLRAGQTLKIIRSGGKTVATVSPRPFYAAGFAGKSWSVPSADTTGSAFAQADTTQNNTPQIDTTDNSIEVASLVSDEGSSDLNTSGLSGVAHLIFLEEQSGEDFTGDEDEPEYAESDNGESVDITQVAAADSEADTSFTEAEFPGFIKTAEPPVDETAPVATAQEPKVKTQYHTVKSGETLTVIAKKYNTTVAGLQNMNALTSSTVQVGQKLKVNSQATSSPQSKAMNSNSAQAQFHTVKSGESLGSIASKYHMSVDALKKLNNLSKNTIRVNQKLRLNSQTPINSNKPLNSSFLVHTTRSGDTLWTLAQKYSVNVSDIKKWNNLNGNSIKTNQKIKILAKN